MNITKRTPPPAPPPTWDITGLTQEEIIWLADILYWSRTLTPNAPAIPRNKFAQDLREKILEARSK